MIALSVPQTRIFTMSPMKSVSHQDFSADEHEYEPSCSSRPGKARRPRRSGIEISEVRSWSRIA